MLDMPNQVRNLLKVDVIDSELHDCRQELSGTPRVLAEQTSILAGLETEAESTRVSLETRRKELGKGEVELAGIEKRRVRAEGRMATLITSTQIEATQREIAALTEEGAGLEETLLEWMEESDELEQALEAQLGSAQTAASALDTDRQTWATRESDLQARIVELEADRSPLFDALHLEFQRRYSIGLTQNRFPPPRGITGVDGYICRTCKTRVSPLWVQEARALTAVHACDSCKRVLAFDPDGGGDVEADEAPAGAISP